MTRDELIALVERIMAGEGKTQAEADRLVDRFVASVPHPEADDLILYPEEHFGREPSAAEIVDCALSYWPVQL